MSSDWSIATLRAANVSLIDCEHRTPPASNGGHPYIAIPQIKNGRIDLSGVRRISRNHLIDWTRKAKPQPYDVVMSRRCNPGETAFVPPGLECALGQNLVLLRADGSKVFPPFLRWLVRGNAWWDQIAKFLNHGAVFESLKCADIPNFQLPIPPMTDQKAIARVLGALDDKIELNRRMNQALEELSAAFFRSWFVDFDPVVARAAGRSPFGLSPEIAALFPCSFVESEIGTIPTGWRVGGIDDIADPRGGGTPQTSVSEYWGGDIPWFSVVDSPESGEVFVLETEKMITRRGLEESATQLLPIGATIITARGTVGNLALVGTPMAMNQSCYALVPKNGFGAGYVFFTMKGAVEELRRNAHGSVFDTITRNTLSSISIVEPPLHIRGAFEQFVAPLLAQIKVNVWQSGTLAATRDTLLPKLLSGELRVRDAEREVAAAV